MLFESLGSFGSFAPAPNPRDPYLVALAKDLLDSISLREDHRHLMEEYLLEIFEKSVNGGGKKVLKDGRRMHMVDFVFGEATEATYDKNENEVFDTLHIDKEKTELPEFDPSDITITPDEQEVSRLTGVEFDE